MTGYGTGGADAVIFAVLRNHSSAFTWLECPMVDGDRSSADTGRGAVHSIMRK
jgi:hypothetical protein